VLVKVKSGKTDIEGAPLMQSVFSVNNPILAFNGLADQSDRDEQQGMMQLYAGAVMAIRNPGGHRVADRTIRSRAAASRAPELSRVPTRRGEEGQVVGREVRAKHAKMPTICYLCGKEITDKKEGDLDHVPPQRIFAKSIRKEQPLQFSTVRVHKKCNQDYKPDEEYFFTALIGEAHSPAGHEAWKDLQETFKDPAHQGLLKQVLQ
jgi:Protein of unknown function (Hypoth_ymh)